MPLYFTRHAKQTRHTLDPHIAKLPSKITSIDFDYAISSPYLRCRETVLALYNGDVYIDVRLAEYKMDKIRLNGQYDEETLSYGDLPPIDESWEEFTQRVDDFIDEYHNKEEKILVVTHGAIINYLINRYSDQPAYTQARYVPYAPTISIII